MITSCVPHEGKSTITANLAVALANKGNNVLLIDMDLRNPTLTKLMNVTPEVSIVDSIKNEKLNSYLIDSEMVHLLRDKEIIGIWCNASNFAYKYDLKGFFTSMFISNEKECKLLCEKEYQKELSFAIMCGIINVSR